VPAKKVLHAVAMLVVTMLDLSRTNEGAFICNVSSVLSENLGGILGGTQC
jgi:hypothetical protein